MIFEMEGVSQASGRAHTTLTADPAVMDVSSMREPTPIPAGLSHSCNYRVFVPGNLRCFSSSFTPTNPTKVPKVGAAAVEEMNGQLAATNLDMEDAPRDRAHKDEQTQSRDAECC